jgi:hypothetical protein
LVCPIEVAPSPCWIRSLFFSFLFFVMDSFFVTDTFFHRNQGAIRGRGNRELVSHEGTTPNPVPNRTGGEHGASGLGVLRHTLGRGVLTRPTAREGVALGKTLGRGWERCGPRVF